MGLFRKQTSPLRDKVSGKLNNIYAKIQGGWANWMALRTAGLTKKGWITTLACLVTLVGSYSGYLIVSAFTSKPAISFKVATIRKPAHAGKTGEVTNAARISDAEYKRIKQFHSYMDSLAADPTGKKAYEDITAKRPGLMDSIRLVENYYQQFKNK